MKFFRLATTILTLTLVSLSFGPPPLAGADQPPQRGVEGPVPESAKYWAVFRHLTALETRAAEVERRGQDGSHYRGAFRASAKLTEAQAARLSSIAADCVARVEEKDREALAIIQAARAAHKKRVRRLRRNRLRSSNACSASATS